MCPTKSGRSQRRAWAGVMVLLALLTLAADGPGAENPAVTRFEDQVQPILIDYCYRCHAQGTRKGGVAFDELGTGEAFLKNRSLWWAVLKNVRAGIMPPAAKPHPDSKDVRVLADWIKRDVFGSDPDRAGSGPGDDPTAQSRRIPQHHPRPDGHRFQGGGGIPARR